MVVCESRKRGFWINIGRCNMKAYFEKLYSKHAILFDAALVLVLMAILYTPV